MQNEQTRGHAVPWILFALTLAGVLSRAYRLCRYPVWLDETSTYHVAKHGFRTIVRILDYPSFQAYPPLYFFLTHVSLRIADSTAMLRLPAILFGVAGIPALYLLGKRVSGTRTGLIAAFLLLFSSFHLYYSQEARAYTLLFLLSVLSIYYFLSLLRRPTRASWALYVLITVANLYSHYFSAWVFLSQLVFFAACILGGNPGLSRADRRKGLRDMAIAAAVVAACYLPWMHVVLKRSTSAAYADTTPPLFSLSYLRALREILAGGPRAGSVYLILSMVGAAHLWRKGKRIELAYLAFMLAFCAAWLNLFLRHTSLFSGRYYIFLIGPFLALVASGADGLYELAPARVKPAATTLFIAAIAWIQGASILGYYREGYSFGTNPKHIRINPDYSWESLANEIRARRGTQMIVPVPFYYIQPISYYLREGEKRFVFASTESAGFYRDVIGLDHIADLSGDNAAFHGSGVFIVLADPRSDAYSTMLAKLETQLLRNGYRKKGKADIANVRVLEYRKSPAAHRLP